MQELFHMQGDDENIFQAAVERLQQAGWFGATLRRGDLFRPQITELGLRRFRELQDCLGELDRDHSGVPEKEMKMILAITELVVRDARRV